jgi:hypothetical protein
MKKQGWVILVAVLAISWAATAVVRQRLIRSRIEQTVIAAGPDAFNGMLNDGPWTVEVPIVPLLVNPLRSHAPAYLMVNGLVRAQFVGTYRSGGRVHPPYMAGRGVNAVRILAFASN